MDRSELILKLVTTGHLNVPERLELGSDTLNLAEVREVIRAVLEGRQFFPPTAQPGATDGGVFEGVFLEKTSRGRFRLHRQRAYPWDPFTVAEYGFKEFDRLETAVREFLKSDWRDTIDGIRIRMA